MMTPETAFIQREESWLEFNYRVLHCAQRPGIPLNERLKFLAITTSNLDEFISVRYSSLISDGDEETRCRILDEIKDFISAQDKMYDILSRELKEEGLRLMDIDKLSKDEKNKLEQTFDRSLFPLLTPINIGSINDLPNLISGQTYIVVTVKENNEEILNLIPIIPSIPKLYQFGDKVIFIEDIILKYLDKIFVKKNIETLGYFRVIKDANILLNHDKTKFILDRMNDTLLKRKFSDPLFMEISSTIPKKVRNALMAVFNLDKKAVHVGYALDYTRFMKPLLPSNYSDEPFTPAPYEVIGEQFSLFSELEERDILLHHPYDSYDTVLKFIDHAADDRDVMAIKMTLYRVSSIDSPIIQSLIRAAENGKQVSVLVEIKARFNESMNIDIVNKLKFAGINVILGEEYLKTHCKFCIVMRKENEDVKIYSHIATGNYNEKTSKIYTDLSYFTAKQKIGYDLVNVFNILSGLSDPNGKLEKVFYSPVNLRSRLTKLIDREISYAQKGKKAKIIIKVNSISDTKMVMKLYEAADAGVDVTIICRGVCSLVPRKNLRIKSIVGRFLEHSRIYYFRNKSDAEWLISSADLLTRNLDKRVEILVSLDEKEIVNKLDIILDALINDESNSYYMMENGDFTWAGLGFDAHQWFIEDATSAVRLKLPKKKK